MPALRPVSALVTALAVLVLAACGGSDHESGGEAAGDAAGFPVRLTDKFGTATIDAPPKDVATVGFNEQDFAARHSLSVAHL